MVMLLELIIFWSRGEIYAIHNSSMYDKACLWSRNCNTFVIKTKIYYKLISIFYSCTAYVVGMTKPPQSYLIFLYVCSCAAYLNTQNDFTLSQRNVFGSANIQHLCKKNQIYEVHLLTPCNSQSEKDKSWLMASCCTEVAQQFCANYATFPKLGFIFTPKAAVPKWPTPDHLKIFDGIWGQLNDFSVAATIRCYDRYCVIFNCIWTTWMKFMGHCWSAVLQPLN